MSVYDVAALGERFDIVLFLGVLYHLRHPLLALDLIHEHVAGDLLRLPVDAARVCARSRTVARRLRLLRAGRLRRAAATRRCTSSSGATPATRPTGGRRTRARRRRCCAAPASRSSTIRRRRSTSAARVARRPGRRGLSGAGRRAARMIEAVKIWNEPNNKSHWDFAARSRNGHRFAAMARLAGQGDPGREPDAAAGARRHVADRPLVHPPADGEGRARRDRRRRGARLPARLEPLADRRVAGQARRDRAPSPTGRCG